jgi:hypothetical protein
VKYTDDLVLLAKEETVLQGMIDSTSEIGKCYEMEMNWKKQGNKNLKATIPHTHYDRHKAYFKHLGCIITSEARYTREIKSNIATTKSAVNKKATVFITKFGLNEGRN